MGMSTAEWSAYLSADFGVRLSPPQVAEQVIASMATEYEAHLPLLPGAVDAVRALAARWPLAVASSAPRSLIEAVLDASGLRPRVHRGRCQAKRWPRASRPRTSTWRRTRAARRAARGRCAAVEDSANGLPLGGGGRPGGHRGPPPGVPAGRRCPRPGPPRP